jgi:galactosamine-6-phosphate isomerase
MNTEIFESFEALSVRAADVMEEAVKANLQAHFCLATGASPLGCYREITRRITQQNLDLSASTITKLDEWLGIPMAHPGTCETFLRNEVLLPWRIKAENYISFNGDAEDPRAECTRIQSQLEKLPVFDVCVLGIGPNGHLGLNEPAEELSLRPHVSTLAPTTRRHPMLGDTELDAGMTMGLGTIMSSRHVLLLIVGESKQDAWRRLQERLISTQLPASFLHLHPNVTCLSALP